MSQATNNSSPVNAEQRFVEQRHIDHARQLYPSGVPAEYDGMEETEFFEGINEAVAGFEAHEKRLPREAAELDAYLGSAEEWTRYLADHPIINASAAAPQENPAPSADPSAILKKFTSAAKTAATHSLRMGELAIGYINARLAHSEACTRDAAVKVLVGVWQEFSDDVVTTTRVNALVRTAAVAQTFAPGADKLPSLRVLREFAPLLERDTEKRVETWSIIPQLADRARALWTEATSKQLSGEECAAAVAQLTSAYKAELAAEAAQKASAPTATDEQRKEAEKAQEAANKANAAAQKKAERTTTKKKADTTPTPKPEVPCRGENLLAQLAASAKAGSTKDFGSMLAQSILKTDDALAVAHDTVCAVLAESKTPDDVVAAMLQAMKSAQSSLSRPAIRAIDAALLILEKASKESKKKAS